MNLFEEVYVLRRIVCVGQREIALAIIGNLWELGIKLVDRLNAGVEIIANVILVSVHEWLWFNIN
jgi:hypothetical protein